MNGYEYVIVYQTPGGQRAGMFKAMEKEELNQVIRKLCSEGCTVEKVEIVRRANV